MFLWISIPYQQNLCQSKTGKEYVNLQWDPNFRFPHTTASFWWSILFLWDGTVNGTKVLTFRQQYINLGLVTELQMQWGVPCTQELPLPSSHSLLLNAVWRHTHTPFLHSAGTWQAALLSRYIRWGSLHIKPSHYWTQSYHKMARNHH